MPKRIPADTDYNILADIALGVPAKLIAKKYNVSIPYVSKIKTGRKKINVYIPEQTKIANQFAYYASDIEALSEFLKTSPMSIDKTEHDSLDALIIQKLTELKVLLKLRKTIKGENK